MSKVKPGASSRNKGVKTIPAGCCLVVLIGPSGAGKSTLIERHFSDGEVVSSDKIRRELFGDFRVQDRREEVFGIFHHRLHEGLKAGRRMVADATHLTRTARYKTVRTARGLGIPIIYLVVDRPLADKHKTSGWRGSVDVNGESLVDYHHRRFQAQLPLIRSGDHGQANLVIETMFEPFSVRKSPPPRRPPPAPGASPPGPI